jgi:opacity protein-like surface antigen
MKSTLNIMKFTLNKKVVLLALAGLTLATANAQVQFGVKAGANIAGFTGSDASGTSSLVSFNAGGLVKIPISDAFSFQPELVYSGEGAKSTTTDPNTGNNINVSFPLNYLNVPLLFKYTRPFGLYTEIGPQIGFLMSAHEKAEGVSADVKSQFNSTNFSLAFGLGYISQVNIGIDFRYNLGLSNIGKAQDGSPAPNLKTGSFQIGIFYMFGDSGSERD